MMQRAQDIDESRLAKQGASSHHQRSASLDELPIELLACIANLLDKEDAMKLRLLGSRYAAAAAPKTFECFHLCCYTFSLDRLRRIATSPLARHLRKIAFHTLVLTYEAISEEQFNERLENRILDGCYDAAPVECWPPRTEWQQARVVLEDYSSQCSAFFTEIAHRSLMSAIVRLPCLEEVEVTSRPLRPDRYPVTALRVSPEAVLRMARTFNPYDRCADGKCTRLIFNALNARAKQPGNAALQTLRLSICLTIWIDPRRAGFPPTTRLSHAWPSEFVAAEHLKTLSLDFQGSRPRKGNPIPKMLSFFLTCQRLQSLELKDDWIPTIPAFTRLCGLSSVLHAAQRAWPLLENLSICELDIRSTEFNPFLSHHSKSLKSLKLDSCCSDDFASTLCCIAENLTLQTSHMSWITEIARGSTSGRARKLYFKRDIEEDGIDEHDTFLE